MDTQAGEGRFLTGKRIAIIVAPATIVFVALMALLFGRGGGEPVAGGSPSPADATTSSAVDTTEPTEPAPVETTTADPPGPSMTQAQFDYVNAASASSSEEIPYLILEEGQKYCAGVTSHRGDGRIADLIENSFEWNEPAIRYLCPSVKPALAAAKLGFDDGTYAVTKKITDSFRQIRPGTYETMPNVHDCYWSRLTDDGDIIRNDFVDFAPGRVRVVIKASDGGFRSDGCTVWLRRS